MAKIARSSHEDDATTQAAQSLDAAARAAGARAVAETDRLAQAASGNGADEAATSVLEILGDQNRHAFEAAAALGRARNLSEIVQVQSDFLGGSFARMGRLNERTLGLFRSEMMSLPTRR
jgi:hypothetical protein